MDPSAVSLTQLREMFVQRMATFEKELQKAPSSPSTLAADFSQFKAQILEALSSLQKQNELLEQQTQRLEQGMERLERQQRRKMLLLHNIPEQKDEDTAQEVVKVVHEHLGLDDFLIGHLKRCHRMGRPAANRSRPILVKFQDVTSRDKVWFTKTKFKGSGVTVSEFLTQLKHEIFLRLRERVGVTKCWSLQGRIFALTPDGSRKEVVTLSDVAKFEACKEPEISSAHAATKRTVAASKPKPKRAAVTKK